MNHTSSRSHCIFKINLRSKLQGSKNEICSSINLIDLAGSEGVAKSDIGGKRLKEGKSINKSLLAMYNVITKLNKKADFICFRESKLTRILQPYLGGNSLTAIICNIHPLLSNYNESVSTLRFAMCAGGIKNNVKINFKAKDNSKLIEDMENELMQMENNIQDIEERKKMHSEKMAQMQEEIDTNQEFIKVGKENVTSLENKISQKKAMSSDHTQKLQNLKKDTQDRTKMVEEYKNKFQQLKEENIFEKIENMQESIKMEYQMNTKQNSELETKIKQAHDQLFDLQRTLKDKKENIKNLKDKNAFLKETTTVLSNSVTPENYRNKTKGSFNNVKKKEAEMQLKFLKKEQEIIEMTILMEQKRIENFQQKEKYNKVKAQYHDLRHRFKK